LNAHTK